MIISLAIIAVVIGFGVLLVRTWSREHVPPAARWKYLGVDLRAPVIGEFSTGFAIGTFAMMGVFITKLLANLLQVSGVEWPVLEILGNAVGIAAAAAAEELLFRGVLINGIFTLHRSLWLAVAVTALLFGLAHIANPNATTLSVVSTMIGGVMYALAYLWSGRLWMPWGLHFAWNFIQGPVLGFPVSGMQGVSIIRQTDTGPALLTGGAYGPEGGLIGIAFRLVVILLLFLWHRWSLRRQPSAS